MGSSIINTNIASLIAQRNLTRSTVRAEAAMARLSSGYRINRSADDVAGLTISESLQGEIGAYKQALRNVQDGISILQIADGALSVIGDNLQRIRELTVQAANDTNSDSERNVLEGEIRTRLEDLNRIAVSTTFNGIALLDGSVGTEGLIQIGGGSDLNANTLDISNALMDARASALGIVGAGATYSSISAIDLTSSDDALAFLADVDNALSALLRMRGENGAQDLALNNVLSNLTLLVDNFSVSNSRIRDVDVADESSRLVQAQIMQQAATSVLSQANQSQNLVLQLLQR